MIDFDFNRYSTEQLRELNYLLVEHLRIRYQRESQKTMNRFELGERVCFKTSDGRIVEGKIIRFNKKTVTIESDCGHQWRVSPQFLDRVVGSTNAKYSNNIIAMSNTPQKGVPLNGPCPCGSGKKYKRCCFVKEKISQ